jgi:SNF2 family DNA or RNA helicase
MALLITNDQGLMILKCSFEEKDRAKKIGFKWSGSTKSWVASFSLQKVEEVIDEFPNCGITDDLEKMIEKQLELDENVKQIKIDADGNIDTRFKVSGIKVALHNYQKHGVKFGINSTGGILIADEMGLGKSIQSLATAIYRKNKGEIDKCLIITPASLKWNWPLEIEKFTDESYSVIAGTPEKREKQWAEDVFFYIVNYELITEDLFGGKDIKVKNSETLEQKKKRVAREQKKKERMPSRLIGQ